MSEFNPYQAPSQDSEAAEPSSGILWQVSGGALLFRDGAQLPDIDVRTGRTDVELTPASAVFFINDSPLAVPPWLQRIIAFGVVFGAMLVLATLDLRHWRAPVFMVMMGVILLVVLTLSRRRKRFRLSWFVDTELESKRRGRTRWTSRCIWLSLGFLFLTIFTGDKLPLVYGILAVFASVFLSAIVARMGGPLTGVRGRDGWCELRGVRPEGLTALAALQYELMEGTRVRRKRRRKVFTAYLYRSPLSTLAGRQIWNPIVVLILIVMKVFRSKSLIRECFDVAEIETLPDADWDSKLKARLDEVRAEDGFADWQPLSALWLDSPVGDARIQWVTLVSPEGQHSLVIALMRQASQKASQEILETTFRSWLRDGRVLLTSNCRLQKPLPANFEAVRQKGTAKAIFAAHLERVEACDVVEASFPEGWERRMEQEILDRQNHLREVGIYGPVGEKEFEEAD